MNEYQKECIKLGYCVSIYVPSDNLIAEGFNADGDLVSGVYVSAACDMICEEYQYVDLHGIGLSEEGEGVNTGIDTDKLRKVSGIFVYEGSLAV